MSHHVAEKLHTQQKNKISTEMYLKTILDLGKKRKKLPRPIDLVKELDVSKGSVSEMLKKLAEEGYVHYESFETIKLTPKGKKSAANVLHKYDVIKQFLMSHLGIAAAQAHEEACNIEHAMSDGAAAKLALYLKKLK